ncbi:hypothetical protein CGZ80_26745 [Rhodopirellula sp. MGV]|nr:hypothetical protein CGZ80_26745 [Rhodopirellula sp. MGV]
MAVAVCCGTGRIAMTDRDSIMASHAERCDTSGYPILVRLFGYLAIQAFLLMLIRLLPWPVVDIYSFVHVRTSVIPTDVWIFYWVQVLLGLFVSFRGKSFLLGEFSLFAFAVLMFAKSARSGDQANVPSSIYVIYWIQFLVATVWMVGHRSLHSSHRKIESRQAVEPKDQPDTEEASSADSPNSTSHNSKTSAARRIHDGRQLAFLSLAVYVIGLVWFLKIAMFESGLGAVFNAVGVVTIGMVSSIALAILASFTYRRALAMLIPHAVTIALLLFLQYVLS